MVSNSHNEQKICLLFIPYRNKVDYYTQALNRKSSRAESKNRMRGCCRDWALIEIACLFSGNSLNIIL